MNVVTVGSIPSCSASARETNLTRLISVCTYCAYDINVDLCILFLTIYLLHSTFVISKGLSEIFRDIRTSTYQFCRIAEKNKSNNHISPVIMKFDT